MDKWLSIRERERERERERGREGEGEKEREKIIFGKVISLNGFIYFI